MNKIYISPSEKIFIESILQGDYTVYAFGSRVTGNFQEYSDLDLCLKSRNEISILEIAELKEKFSNSNLVYTVDISDYDKLQPPFKKHIDENSILFSSATAAG